jgi:hypothetical protein
MPLNPFLVESYGRLGAPAMQMMHTLGSEAAPPGQNNVTRDDLLLVLCVSVGL